jgi:hypothetical protein
MADDPPWPIVFLFFESGGNGSSTADGKRDLTVMISVLCGGAPQL